MTEATRAAKSRRGEATERTRGVTGAAAKRGGEGVPASKAKSTAKAKRGASGAAKRGGRAASKVTRAAAKRGGEVGPASKAKRTAKTTRGEAGAAKRVTGAAARRGGEVGTASKAKRTTKAKRGASGAAKRGGKAASTVTGAAAKRGGEVGPASKAKRDGEAKRTARARRGEAGAAKRGGKATRAAGGRVESVAAKRGGKAASEATRVAAKYPFPFFGAGLASYFEWGSLYVWFEEPPPRAARAGLVRAIPEPFRRAAEWGSSVLYAGSGDQFINLHICMAYAALGDPRSIDPDDDDGSFGFGVGQPFPNPRQSRAFEADLRAWLLDLHERHPIAFVARREDGEAGGTQLDAWHRWSLGRFADVVLPRWQAHHRKPPHRLADWALRVALDLALASPIADQVPAAAKAWCDRAG